MEYNLLDRIMDEDYYGPGSAEFLLRGMSPEGQKKFIKDVSRKLSRKLSGSGFSKSDRKQLAENIEKSINMMPEELQDSWLISAGSPRTKIFLDESVSAMEKPSNYSPETNSIIITDRIGGDRKSSIIHEVGHHADFNMSPKAVVDGKKINKSASAFAGLADDIRKDVINGRTDEWIDHITGKEKFSGEDADVFDPKQQLYDNIDNFVVNETSVDRGSNLSDQVERSIADWHSLNNHFPFFVGHGNVYRKGAQRSGLAYRVGNTTDMPWDVLRDYPKEEAEKIAKFSEDYPVAVEGPSNFYEIVGTEGGTGWTVNNMPNTYGKMEALAKADIRKPKFIPPHERYADELGIELLKKRKLSAEKRRKSLLDRYNAAFMALPEDKRNYYESAKPGDVLWMKDPSAPTDDNMYYVIKGDPDVVFRGNKLQKLHRDPYTFSKNKGRFSSRYGSETFPLDQLEPGYVTDDEFLKSNSEYNSKRILDRLKKRRR